MALSESNGSNKKNDAPTVTTRPISDGKQTYSFSISARDAQNGWGESISKQSETSQHEDYCLKTSFAIKQSKTEPWEYVVEIWQDDLLVGVIYPHPEDCSGIRLLSRHPSKIKNDKDEGWPTDLKIMISTEKPEKKKP